MNNYWDDENYSFVLPAKAIKFDYINFEYGYDTLWIYDGSLTSGKLLGAFSGDFDTLKFEADSGYFTIRVKTDGRTTANGWQLIVTQVSSQPPDTNKVTIDTAFIYPNPARTYLSLGKVPKGRYYVIRNLQGNIVKAGFYNGKIKLVDLPSGIYILQYFSDKIYKAKFVKY
jgi:hypothetical protein